ncbi:enoyl-CoA hydratase/isomerase family protein [Alicyclobacillus mengziensis]|uniref:Enoyl-CoA hydratase/isomerase family protein n=1 Tax=Alicyclobacillus mengziensis TaxID=2931921 RepID=A0A9X7VZW9_9BACL|nr:enoyl-CoA hydratase-related protein [Alicyclobacillus mengziensis]QSO47622.1 enoyl-CoA hydratase/isomerase family protein [Alicyclobacillus mengziensis]
MANHYELVDLTVADRIATLTLKREKQLNALSQELLTDLDAAIGEVSWRIRNDGDVRVLLLQGAGRAFAAGADIAQMKDLSAPLAESFSQLGQRVFTSLERLPIPTIALVHGYALGGGMELAMACDMRIAAEGTKFGQPEVTLGVVPGFGGSQRLPKIVGQGNALHLLLTGDSIDANEAHRIGLVTQVVPAQELSAAGLQVANRLLQLGPQALAGVKRAVYEGAELTLDAGLAFEAARFGMCFATEEQQEGMAAFVERRKPSFGVNAERRKPGFGANVESQK